MLPTSSPTVLPNFLPRGLFANVAASIVGGLVAGVVVGVVVSCFWVGRYTDYLERREARRLWQERERQIETSLG